MKRCGFVAGLLFALCGPHGATARIPETPLFRQFGAADGLPSSTVDKLAQDRAGYLWLGTRDGLARFDGVAFRVWQHDPADPASLPANNVQALHVDAQDRLWLGAEGGGLSLMDAERRGFRHFRASDDARFALADVWAITSTPDGVLWFGGYGSGLYRYDLESEQVQVFRHAPAQPNSLSGDHILALTVDDSGRLWIGTASGLDRYDDTGFEHIDGLSAPTVFSLHAEAGGPLWIGTSGGLDLRSRDGRIEAAPGSAELREAGVTAIARDRYGTHWLATRRGLRHLVDDALHQYPGRSDRRFSIATSTVMDALEDHEGGMWFGTRGGGVQRLSPDWRNFAVLLRDAPERGGLSSLFPRGLSAARAGGLWAVGVSETLDRVFDDGRVTRHFDQTPKLPETALWSVLEDRNGVLWIGHQNGLSRYDPVSQSLRSWARGSEPDAAPTGPVDLLAEAPDGTLWLSALGAGVQQRDADGRVLASFAAGDASGLGAADTEQIEFAPDGRLWLAGDGGLHRFDPTRQRFVAVAGTPTTRVFAFDFVAEGLWLQRLGALERYRFEGDGLTRVESVDAERGLPAVEAGGLRVDREGRVWLSTARGLWRYTPDSQELRQYGLRDGLPSPEFSNRPMLRLPDGSIAAPTFDGLVWFDPGRLREEPSLPRLRFEQISIRRGEQTLTLEPDAPIELQHDDRELHIAARLISFADPRSQRYRFRLRGFDPDWIDQGAQGERVFSQLPPGSYRFEAVAANADGVWSAPPLTLDLRVAPPWWNTAAARAGWIALSLALLALAAVLYRRRLKRRLASQLEMQRHEWTLRASEAKSSFLATLGHEIRTPMTGVLGMTELLLRTPLADRQREYAEAIRRSGDLLLKLVNDALDLARIEAGKLELADAPFDLGALLRDVAELQRPLAQTKALDYAVTIAPDAPRWVRGDALRLQQILLNLGNNAIKFTEHGRVTLALAGDVAPYRFALRVADTGPGLNAEQRARLFQRFSQADGLNTARRYGGSGLGLAICQELAAAMQGRIDVESEPGIGTTFIVRLPLPEAETITPAATIDVPATASQRRILLVEDDATIAAVVRGLLEAQGHAVAHAAQGLAALAELTRERFDLAFLDLDLPGLDGFELARLIRAQGHVLPLVALTARTDPEAESRARAAGMNDFLRKPVSGTQLAEAIEIHLVGE